MDFKEVRAFFDDALFYEECRPLFSGEDFKAKLDSLPCPGGATDEDITLRKCILVAVHAILREQTEDALEVLQTKAKTVEHPVWKLRLNSYSKYAYTVHHQPPLTRCCGRMRGPAGIVIKKRESKESYEKAIEEVRSAFSLMEAQPASAVVEHVLFCLIQHVTFSGIEAARRLNPPRGIEQHDFSSGDEANQAMLLVTELHQCLQILSVILADNDAPKIANYLTRLRYELECAIGFDTALNTLTKLRGAYQNDNDQIGLALCDMIEGDAVLSGPHTSPLVLNASLTESWVPGPSGIDAAGLPPLLDLKFDGEIKYDVGLRDGNTDLSLYRMMRHYAAVESRKIELVQYPGGECVAASVNWVPKARDTSSKNPDEEPDTRKPGIDLLIEQVDAHLRLETSVTESENERLVTTPSNDDPDEDSKHREGASPQPQASSSKPDSEAAPPSVEVLYSGVFISPEAFTQAESFYKSSENWMAMVDSARGKQAVTIRKVCLGFLRCMAMLAPHRRWWLQSEHLAPMLSEAALALQKLEDYPYARLALLLHSFLAREKSLLDDIGKLRLEEGMGDEFTLQLVLVAKHFGDFLQYRNAQTEASLRAYSIARVILGLSLEKNEADISKEVDKYFQIFQHSLLMFTHHATDILKTWLHAIRLRKLRYLLLQLPAALGELSIALQLGWRQIDRQLQEVIETALLSTSELLKDIEDDRTRGSLAWMLVFYLESYVLAVYQITMCSRQFSKKTAIKLQSLIKTVASELSEYSDLSNFLANMEARLLALLAHLTLYGTFARALVQGDAAKTYSAHQELGNHAREILFREDLWPLALHICGKVSAAAAHEKLSKVCSELLASFQPWSDEVSYSVFDSAWSTAIGKFQQVERFLEGAIDVRNWPFANDLLTILARMAPGYKSRIACISPIPSWRRALLVALVEEGLGNHADALRFIITSLGELQMAVGSYVGDIQDRADFYSHPDMARAVNLCAKLYVQSHDRGIDLRQDGFASTHTLGTWPYVDQPVDCGPIDQYPFMALYHMEGHRSLALHQIQQLHDPSVADDDYREWALQRKNFILRKELIGAMRELTDDENAELAILEKHDTSRRMTTIDLIESQHILSVAGNFEYLPGNALVIYTSLSVDGLCVIALYYQGVYKSCFFEDGTLHLLESRVNLLNSLLESYKHEASEGKLSEIVVELSQYLVDPFEEAYDEPLLEHVIFILAGPLAQLPISMLIYKEAPLIATKAVSTVPSLTYLRYAEDRRLKARESKETQVLNAAIIARPGSYRENMLGGPPALPFAGIESIFVGRKLGSQVRLAQSIEADALEKIMSHTIIHIATHGEVDPDAPLLSTISLAKPTRIVDLFGVTNCKAKIVVLSACKTAFGTVSPGNDIMGFREAFLAAGAEAVLGSLWHTNDLVTMVHMIMFYGLLFDMRDENIAVIWRQATCNLIEMGAEGVTRLLKGMIDILQTEDVREQAEALVKNCIKRLQEGIRTVKDIDFSHPYYWAPFVLTGYSEVRFMTTVEDQL